MLWVLQPWGLLLPAPTMQGALLMWWHPPAPAFPCQPHCHQGMKLSLQEKPSAALVGTLGVLHAHQPPISKPGLFLALRVFITEKNVSTYFSPSSLWNMRHTLVMLKGVDLWLTLSLISPQSFLELLSRWDSITSFIT